MYKAQRSKYIAHGRKITAFYLTIALLKFGWLFRLWFLQWVKFFWLHFFAKSCYLSSYYSEICSTLTPKNIGEIWRLGKYLPILAISRNKVYYPNFLNQEEGWLYTSKVEISISRRQSYKFPSSILLKSKCKF